MNDCLVRWFADEPEAECHRAVAVCSECVRALALKWWGGIARHGFDVTTPCLLCGHGEASYCADHALAAVLRQREALIENGATLGEPDFVLSREAAESEARTQT